MTQKPKSWIWKLTGPFAASNYTTIGDTIYYPKKHGPAEGNLLKHEMIHSHQQKKEGLKSFVFKYLFCFPFLWNKYRFEWEWEAYRVGSGWPVHEISRVLRSSAYGWLRNKRAV